MPLGLNRSGDFRNGTPITLPHDFGTDITEPHDFGNDITEPKDFGNPVTWLPNPAHFGNIIAPPTPVNPAPTVASINVATGGILGGTAVTITGIGFLTGATVLFGANDATSVVVVSSTSITCVTPAGTTGAVVSVTVVNTDLQSGSLPSAFTYWAAPTITPYGISPNTGVTTGGTSVTIDGSGFRTGATVTFAGVPATSVVVVSDVVITCITPNASVVGGAVVVVTNTDGQDATDAVSFTYTAAGPMLIAHAAAGGVGYPPSSTTAAIDTRLANFIVIAAGVDTYTAADNTISDSEHNIWTHIPGTTNIGNGSPEFYYCVNPNVSSTHTFTNTTTQYCTSIAVQAWSGISLTPFSGSYIDSNGVSQPPAPLTPNIGDLVVFAVGGNSSVTVANITVLPSGFTVTDALDPVSFSENHTSMGYAIFDGTSATTVLLYDPTVTYGEGTVVNDGAGNYYIALYGSNVGHALVGSGWWAPFAPGSYCQPVFAGTTGTPSEILASFAHA